MNYKPPKYSKKPRTIADLETLWKSGEIKKVTPIISWKEYKSRFESSWKELAGPHLDRMRSSRDEAVKEMSSPFAALRSVAFQLLLKDWKPDADILPQCLHAIRHDPDP